MLHFHAITNKIQFAYFRKILKYWWKEIKLCHFTKPEHLHQTHVFRNETQLALMRFRSEDIKIRKWKRKLETWATRHWLPNFGEKTRKSNYLLGRLIVSRWMDKLSSTIQIVRSKPKCNISCTRLFPYYLANLQPVSQHLKRKFVFSGSIWLSWKRHWKRPTHIQRKNQN